MSIYIFDVHGTLVGNSEVSDEDTYQWLLRLRDAGHRIVLMTGLPDQVPERLRTAAHEVREKPVDFKQFDPGSFVFDDYEDLLDMATRMGMMSVPARRMGEFIAGR